MAAPGLPGREAAPSTAEPYVGLPLRLFFGLFLGLPMLFMTFRRHSGPRGSLIQAAARHTFPHAGAGRRGPAGGPFVSRLPRP
ncbi:hypothetical protein GCM10010372_07980 [Streptomyces tauricus]|nr:hypothetical protein GCM10010372_07980 [Streptomyces tauricus]